MKNKSPQVFRIVSVALLIGAILAQSLLPLTASAAQITNRKLTLQAGVTDGGSKPSGVVNHEFSFDVPSSTTVGSVRLEYCTLAAGTCTVPPGLDTTTATLGANSGAISGLAVVAAQPNGTPYLTRTSATITPGNVVIRLDGVTNPSATNTTFFVRIATFASTDTTGASTDTGVVAASTATQIILDGTMPESLVFCTGETVGLTSGVPDCATATAGIISFNQLFSPTDTATASSQMAASTNAGFGYIITVNGPTLTSGANTIAAMPATGLGVRGTAQFGMNLKLNTVLTSTVPVGAEVSLAPNGTNLKGQASANYATVDEFRFVSGDTVADSFNGGAGGSDAQIFTVSYIANVPGSQPAGTYTSTLTYICTPTF